MPEARSAPAPPGTAPRDARCGCPSRAAPLRPVPALALRLLLILQLRATPQRLQAKGERTSAQHHDEESSRGPAHPSLSAEPGAASSAGRSSKQAERALLVACMPRQQTEALGRIEHAAPPCGCGAVRSPSISASSAGPQRLRHSAGNILYGEMAAPCGVQRPQSAGWSAREALTFGQAAAVSQRHPAPGSMSSGERAHRAPAPARCSRRGRSATLRGRGRCCSIRHASQQAARERERACSRISVGARQRLGTELALES